MNISHIFLYRYTIPLTEPVTVKGHPVVQRDGIVLALKSCEGDLTAYGEIAPLPGLHRETLEMAEAQLLDLVCSHSFCIPGPLPDGLFPSVQTGVEMAMLNLEAAASGTPPAFFPSAVTSALLPLNALLSGDAASVPARAESLYELGYRVFKLKVNAGNTSNAIECIHSLHRRFGNKIELRLDANQSFALDDAVAFIREIPAGSISYIEEPIRNPAGIEEFHRKTSIRSALDETLWLQPELLGMIPAEALGALILKPNRIGGISKALTFFRHARENGLKAVISSAFESGISLGMYAWLAASASPDPAACGLDTFRYLQYDLLELPFGSDNSLIDSRKAFLDAQNVNLHTLKPLSIWTS